MKEKGLGQWFLGIGLTIILAAVSRWLAGWLPQGIISPGVIAMLLGMILHPWVKSYLSDFSGIDFTAKTLLKLAIVLMGASLSLSQVFEVGRHSLIVMVFTLATAFGFGNLFGRWFGMNWKLSNLISAGTGICGGSAVAAIAPTIDAKDEDVAYAISATFIFDILMVILFPIAGRWLGMSDLGFGLWSGTAINDTSSVVAAGYAFSEAAGNYAVIVKLTRTLSIVPVVMIFSLVKDYVDRREAQVQSSGQPVESPSLWTIFPFFILLFLGMVVLRSVGWITPELGGHLSTLSRFLMVMSLGAIGLRTDFKRVAKSGFLPMFHGFLISALVVLVSYAVQVFMHLV